MATLHYQTIRGVYLDIKFSHFRVEVGDIEFYFSSEWNMKRFKEKCFLEGEEFTKKAEAVYWHNHQFEFDNLGLIRLYQKIEKRGFYINYKGTFVDCPEKVTFKIELLID